MEHTHGSADKIHYEFPSISPRGRVDYVPDSYRRILQERLAQGFHDREQDNGKQTHPEQKIGKLAIEESAEDENLEAEASSSNNEELISKMLETAGFEACTVLYGDVDVKPEAHYPLSGKNGYRWLKNKRLQRGKPYQDPRWLEESGQLKEALKQARIAEIVRSLSNEENRLTIYYDLVPGVHDYNSYLDGTSRPNTFRCVFVLDSDLGLQFIEAAKENPAILHQLIDKFMSEQILESQDEWQKHRPPYEAWSAEEGTQKIAFTDKKSIKDLSTVQIIDY